MAAEKVTKVTRKSWFKRLGEAFIGVLVGLILFLAAFPLLWWNEGRAVQTARSLDEASELVISVSSDAVNPENNGKLVHVVAAANTEDILQDPYFDVSVNAIKLKRDAEMYQWEEQTQRETEREVGGGEKTVTTYTYNKTWSSSLIDSRRFEEPAGRENPSEMEYDPREFIAREVSLDAFELPSFLVDKITGYEQYSIDSTAITDRGPQYSVRNNEIYVGANSSSPEIGDQRIRYQVVKPATVSVIARQVDNTFESYPTEAGDEIALLNVGSHSAENMLAEAHRHNVIITWLLRAAGLLVMMLGIGLVFKPLAVFGDVIPLIGDLLRMGTGIFAFAISLFLTLITISIAWLFYRPLIGIALIVIAVAIVFSIKKMAPAREQAQPAQS